MVKVRFYDDVEDSLLKFAVIITRHVDKWVFCKHRKRETYEVPGGHREPGEVIEETARRELYEETGALDYDLDPICVYSVASVDEKGMEGEETFGMLYVAEVRTFEEELHSEIEKIVLMEDLPQDWTYPDIQPYLIREAQRRVRRTSLE
nr:NUDIX domain-containing protein [uncultured Sellimonas sp.]